MSRTITVIGKPPLGMVIAIRLKEIDKTQKWLAEKAKVNPIYLCAVMAGRANPTINFLQRIAKCLNLDVKTLTNALLYGK